jgi:ATP-dependent RNA helicase DDX46/PRP5
MSPTRELALQTTKECKKFAKLFNIRCVAVYGGTGISEQIVSLVFSNEKCLFNDVF